jgi:chorismate synthase
VASSWGQQVTISLFGESHGPAIGVVIDGLPAGEILDLEAIRGFMARRAPGRSPWSTARQEEDTPQILSGVYQGKTTGTPLAITMGNLDARPQDYQRLSFLPRPSHADYTGMVRFGGAADPRGGGHFSGRLTASLGAAGAVCKQILERRDIQVFARVAEIGGIADGPLDTVEPDPKVLRALADKELPVLDQAAGAKMVALVEKVREEGDSVGGVVQCLVLGLPAGLGDPIFGGVESRLASLLYGIPAVKALSFGDGYAACRRRGSQNNDPFCVGPQGRLGTLTNHEGGINGGITNGMPLVLQIGIKPTPSIARAQQTVNIQTMQEETLSIRGRHDPCIVPRAAVAVEGAVAICILDLLLVSRGVQGLGGADDGTTGRHPAGTSRH